MGVLFSRPEPVKTFDASDWVATIQAAVIGLVQRSSRPIKYAEIGKTLGLNETCISKTKFKDAMIMVVCEDLIEKGQVKVSNTVGWPFIVSKESNM
tara:strand:- start:1006 stop:1293 length:288 start_codon:yes stop_codon:yes gene_type:complete